MSVPGIGYVIDNKARVALERALRNRRKRILGVEWESILTFGLMPPKEWESAMRASGGSALAVHFRLQVDIVLRAVRSIESLTGVRIYSGEPLVLVRTFIRPFAD